MSGRPIDRRRFIAGAGAVLGSAAAHAHFAMPALAEPPEAVPGPELRQPPARRSRDGFLDTILHVERRRNRLGGQWLAPGRTYEGELTGPTLRLKPGGTLAVRLENNLEPSAGVCSHHSPGHCLDHTNLHTHGLHVSPSGSADNVFIDVPPGERFQYEIPVPADHPAGLFWYHPHRHGTVAGQVMEGMAGALIIEGGLDDIPEIRRAREIVAVMQQYMIPGLAIENLQPITINGQLRPTVRARPGEVLRWRFVHATTIDFIELALRRPDGGSAALHLVAEDGLATGRIETLESHFMNPGNRAELLTRLTTPGEYVLYGKAQAQGLRDFPLPEQALAHVRVEGRPADMALPDAASLAGLAPFAPIGQDELTGRQPDLWFEGTSGAVSIDGKTFDPARIDRRMRVGDIEEWTLFSKTGSHPFHIHVNPFQVIRVNGVPVENPIWRDVTLVRSEWKRGVTIRTRYRRFTGKSVLHCHNLVHEDKGMMQAFELLPAGSAPASRSS